MKVVIWIACIFLVSAITTALKANGIILGAIPTAAIYGGAVALAGFLCKLLDKKRKGE